MIYDFMTFLYLKICMCKMSSKVNYSRTNSLIKTIKKTLYFLMHEQNTEKDRARLGLITTASRAACGNTSGQNYFMLLC